MKENYQQCIDFVFLWEAGYVNNPRDPGGPTNRGITIATLSHELGRQATIADVKGLSKELAESIYRKKYWNAVGGDTLPSGVDLMAMDTCVTSGVGRALQWLRESGHLPAGNRIVWWDSRRRGFFQALKSFRTFGRGWLRREKAAYALAIKLRERH